MILYLDTSALVKMCVGKREVLRFEGKPIKLRVSRDRETPRKKLHSIKGFTTMELLVVVAIISLLAAMAIPQYSIYRSRSIDAQMTTGLRNAATAMESYYAQYNAYPMSVSGITAAGFRQTSGVTLTITIISPSSYTLTASNPSGTQGSFSYNSNTGLIN